MTKTSKVKEVSPSGTFDSNGKTYFKFEYAMETGEILTASHQTKDNAFNVGDDVEYEITKTNQYGNYGKVRKPNSGANSYNANTGQRSQSTNDAILIQTCAKITADLYIGLGGPGVPEPKEVASYAENLAKQLKESLKTL